MNAACTKAVFGPPPFERMKHPASDKIDDITTGRLPLAT